MKKAVTMMLGVTLVGALLAGCGVHSNPARTTVYTPGGSVTYHCPPGQAKKGNC